MPNWKTHPDFPSYVISDEGVVHRHHITGRLLKGTVTKKGYRQFGLRHRDGSIRTVLLNRLVCELFVGPPPSDKHEAAHWDGKPLNNRSGNLRWATRQENEDDKKVHGTRPRGQRVYNALLTDEIVRAIRTSTWPEYALAKHYGVSRGAINKAKSGDTWRHVDG